MVWQHPIHWYGMPPLMKLWLDEVLAFGWAYGPGGTALRGKDLWLVASTGGAEESYRPDSYNRYFFDAFLPPYEQTAALVRHALPAAAGAARRAPRERRPSSPRMSRCSRSACAATPTGPRSPSSSRAPPCEVPAERSGRATSVMEAA